MSGDSSRKKEGEAVAKNDEEVRVVLVGKTGAGKSASGNTILASKVFESKFSLESLTMKCEKGSGLVAGRKISVVDTPGFFDTRFSKEGIFNEIKQCVCFAAPGPHVFLIVIKLGRFTEEEQKSVDMIQEVFGQMSAKYTMILFTHGDEIGDETIEDIVKNCPKLIGKCEGRYHVFNNKTKDPSQVTELLEKINKMVLENGGSHYTTEMFQEAERAIEEEKQRILKETEQERRKEEEELKSKFEKMIEEKLEQHRSARKMEKSKSREMEEMRQILEKGATQLKEQQEQLEAQKALKVRHEQEARNKAEKYNIFMTAGQVIGRACQGEIGAAIGGVVGTVMDNLVGSSLSSCKTQ